MPSGGEGGGGKGGRGGKADKGGKGESQVGGLSPFGPRPPHGLAAGEGAWRSGGTSIVVVVEVRVVDTQ